MLILEDLKPGLPPVGLESASVATIAAFIPISDADGAAFQLTCEAKRIDLAFLFDPMMAVHTSNVDPLPHQITAVYESMLHKQPLRFVLADDPGAGKTIMAGLCIRELIMRDAAGRQRKPIIFSEHRDTLNYLPDKIAGVPGNKAGGHYVW